MTRENLTRPQLRALGWLVRHPSESINAHTGAALVARGLAVYDGMWRITEAGRALVMATEHNQYGVMVSRR